MPIIAGSDDVVDEPWMTLQAFIVSFHLTILALWFKSDEVGTVSLFLAIKVVI